MSIEPHDLQPPYPTASSSTRRNHHRIGVKLDVTVESESNFYAGFSLNISEGGLFIATFDTQPVGTSVSVSLNLDDGAESIIALGTVRWVREYNSIIPDMSPGMGVQFTDLSERSRDRINAFCAELREPLFFDDDDV